MAAVVGAGGAVVVVVVVVVWLDSGAVVAAAESSDMVVVAVALRNLSAFSLCLGSGARVDICVDLGLWGGGGGDDDDLCRDSDWMGGSDWVGWGYGVVGGAMVGVGRRERMVMAEFGMRWLVMMMVENGPNCFFMFL